MRLEKSTFFFDTDYEKEDSQTFFGGNYQSFGSPMTGRTFSSEKYRFGYQSSEKTDEISGLGNHYTTQFRELDTRLARWWSVDPIFKHHESPYVSMGNNPIWHNDVLGNTDDKATKSNPNNPNRKGGKEKFHNETKSLVKKNDGIQRDKRLEPTLKASKGNIDKAIEKKKEELTVIEKKEQNNESGYKNMLITTTPDGLDPKGGLTLVRIIKTVQYEKAKIELEKERSSTEPILNDLEIKKSEQPEQLEIKK
jgi:RHS repeat-associated protein